MTSPTSSSTLAALAREALHRATENLSHAQADLAALPIDKLELDVLLAMFITDELGSAHADNSVAGQLQSVVMLQRDLAFWRDRYQALYQYAEFINYRMRRDLFIAARLACEAIDAQCTFADVH